MDTIRGLRRGGRINLAWAKLLGAALATVRLAAANEAPRATLIDQGEMNRALADRAARQNARAGAIQAFHTFSFTDATAASGITFTQQFVEDAGKHFKGNHYDHGNAVVAADVDGDGLPDLYFTTQLGSNRLYRNLGGGKFQDITETAGVGMKDQVSVGASFADLDNDGLPDLVVTTVRHGNRLFRNLGGGRFEDVTGPSGVGYSGHSSGVVLFDYDNDGLLDIFVCNVGRYTTDATGPGGYYLGFTNSFAGHLYPDRTEYSILYKNLGGLRFKDVTEEAGLRLVNWCGDAAFADLNGDGFPDLYVLNMQGDNHYMENQGGRRFVDKTSALFPKTPWGAMGVKFFDFNQDGLVDLFVTDMHSDMSGLQTRISKTNFSEAFEKGKSEAWCTTEYNDSYLQGASNNIFGNAFQKNLGGGRFAEVSDEIGAETFWPWGVTVGDFNADGFGDVFIPAGMGFGFRYGINSLLLNDGGKRFADAEFIVGVEPRAAERRFHTAFVLDCSGADRDHPLARGHTGKVPFSAPASSRSAVAVDLDGDGDLDLVTNEMGDPPMILLNDLTTRRRVQYLKVSLQGTRSNRDGLGARVQVTAGGRTWHQGHDGKSGHLGQSALPLYFGLADATTVERVEVFWPSGRKQVVEGTAPNQMLRIVEAGTAP
jgi:enediyne biosynthesis protein E4